MALLRPPGPLSPADAAAWSLAASAASPPPDTYLLPPALLAAALFLVLWPLPPSPATSLARLLTLALLLYLFCSFLSHRHCAGQPLLSVALRAVAASFVRARRVASALPLLRAALAWDRFWGAAAPAHAEHLAALAAAAQRRRPPRQLLSAAAYLRAGPLLARLRAWLDRP